MAGKRTHYKDLYCAGKILLEPLFVVWLDEGTIYGLMEVDGSTEGLRRISETLAEKRSGVKNGRFWCEKKKPTLTVHAILSGGEYDWEYENRAVSK